MAKFSGKDSRFRIDDNGGTLRDVSNDIQSIDFPLDVADLDTTGFGQTAHSRILGLKDTVFSIRGFLNDAAVAASPSHSGLYTVMALLYTNNTQDTDFEFYPAGTTAGRPKITGKCIITNLQISDPVDGVVGLNITGGISDGNPCTLTTA